jgi:predicted nicotinamide N-methyase
LELGSGNGFLSVCLLAVASPELVVITDTDEHLPLIEKTLKANESIIDEKIRKTVSVEEYLWGTKPSNENQRVYYDLIIGSDLAYRDALHDPLIQSLLQFSSPETITLLGVTLLDTKPIFFQKLSKAGFKYERLADHLLDPSFRGTNFGIFVIQRKKEVLD